ncbi:MAG: Ig-like domain-containing protein [Longimicrobiales bacterium]|nr:Ig-like domain-containing protein [Longimicrobiales bacterium]
MRRLASPAALLAIPLLFAAGGCDGESSPVAADFETAALLSVAPQGGATGVTPGTDVVLDFDHPLRAGMEAYVDLHEGDVTGPEVPGAWSLSADGLRLSFTPDQPLKPLTDYTVHIGGGMMSRNGQPVDFERHGFGMGGDWATSGMMSGGMGGGGMGGQQGYHMGEGWQHPTNGTYGMVFTFTTGA